MQAVVIAEPGGPEVLTLAEVPDPVPGSGEVLLSVAATAVNRADLLQRQGHYPPPPGAPAWPGLECSGTVTDLGEGVTSWARGDRVCALLPGGGYAEEVAVPEGLLMPLPDGIGLEEAAALPEAVCTVHSNVFALAGLTAGQTLLVHGGSSGVGTMAIQLARQAGATVAVTAGTTGKLRRCSDLGAQILVNYREEDFVEQVRRHTDGHGADVVLDTIGAKYLERNMKVLAHRGRIVTIGLMGGRRGELDLGTMIAKQATLMGTSLRNRPLDERVSLCADVVRNIWPLLATRRVHPVVHARLPLAQAAQAHRMVAESQHVGKVLLHL
jgi:putative PIG3 family NAD(P)H quinone oxidoreductase